MTNQMRNMLIIAGNNASAETVKQDFYDIILDVFNYTASDFIFIDYENINSHEFRVFYIGPSDVEAEINKGDFFSKWTTGD